MNKEKLMELFAEALDKNCSISLHFSQYQGEERLPVSKNEAQELALNFAAAFGTEHIEHNVGLPHADDFQINISKFRIVCSYIPSDEEKADGARKRIEDLKKELAKLEKDEGLKKHGA